MPHGADLRRRPDLHRDRPCRGVQERALAADNGSNSYGTSTNSPNFTIENYCGPAPDPAGGAAFLRITETQPSGSMAQNAYAFAHYDSPPWVHFRTAGAYTREPESFNDGWRARFWVTGGSAGERQVFIQGAGLPNAGEQAVSWPTFGPHLWQVGGYLDFTRFVYELKCVRPAGCDRAGFNAVDANTFNFVLSDEFASQVSMTSTGDPFMDGAWVKGTHGIAYTWTERGSGCASSASTSTTLSSMSPSRTATSGGRR